MKKVNISPAFIGFLQTTAFLTYVGLVATFMNNANSWLGPEKNYGFLGPMLFLSLFSFSAIYSALIVFGYPFYVFWIKKNFNLAAKIVGYSAIWLLLFIVFVISLLAVFR